LKQPPTNEAQMSDRYKNIATHPLDRSNGQSIDPGEVVTLTSKEFGDTEQAHADAGTLIAVPKKDKS
jgi:hypothetical protein